MVKGLGHLVLKKCLEEIENRLEKDILKKINSYTCKDNPNNRLSDSSGRCYVKDLC